MLTDTYYKETLAVLEKIQTTQKDKIKTAAEIVARTIKNDGIIYIFGCGHSHLIALDSFYRAGGLANVSAVLDTDLMLHNGAAKSSHMEKMQGISEAIIKRYCMTPRDVFIVVSTSGKNAVPVEAAIEARKLGVPTIGILSSEYFGDTPKFGKMLHENVDLYIDNCIAHGDAVVGIYNSPVKMGSISTTAGSFIMQSVLLEAADMAARDGAEIPVYMSSNVEGGGEYNKAIVDKFLPRIKHL